MSLFDRFVLGQPLTQPRDLQHASTAIAYSPEVSDESEDSDEITLQYIIENKPDPKEVREFFRACLAEIKTDEEILFSR